MRIRSHGRPSIYLGRTWSKLFHGVTEFRLLWSCIYIGKLISSRFPIARSVEKSFTSELVRLLKVLLSHRQLNQLPWRLPQSCPYYSCRSQFGNRQQETTVSVSSDSWIYGELVTSLSSYEKGERYNSKFPRLFHQWIRRNYRVNFPTLCFGVKLKQQSGSSPTSIEVKSFT